MNSFLYELVTVQFAIATGDLGRKIMVVVDSKVKEIRVFFVHCCFVCVMFLKHPSVYTDIKNKEFVE